MLKLRVFDKTVYDCNWVTDSILKEAYISFSERKRKRMRLSNQLESDFPLLLEQKKKNFFHPFFCTTKVLVWKSSVRKILRRFEFLTRKSKKGSRKQKWGHTHTHTDTFWANLKVGQWLFLTYLLPTTLIWLTALGIFSWTKRAWHLWLWLGKLLFYVAEHQK